MHGTAGTAPPLYQAPPGCLIGRFRRVEGEAGRIQFFPCSRSTEIYVKRLHGACVAFVLNIHINTYTWHNLKTVLICDLACAGVDFELDYLSVCAVCRVLRAFCNRQIAKIRVKNREPVPVYAMEMEPQERDSDLGDDSPVVSNYL